MKKLLLSVIMLITLSAVSMAGVDRTGVIRHGYTMLSRAMAFTAADSIVTSDSLVISITNIQDYLQHQTVTTTLTDIDEGSPSVTITLRGRAASTGDWHVIGTPVTWTGEDASNPASITSTTPLNYNYLKVSYVASGAAQHLQVATFAVKTVNVYSYGGNLNLGAGYDLIGSSTSDITMHTDKFTVAGATGNTLIAGTLAITGATTATGAINANGTINVKGAINQAIAGGTVVTSAGLLGGGGTATNATQTLGAAGGKAFSYYLNSTSSTASHVLTGYYMNVNYGATGGATAAPSGDVIRGRAYLMGDASGTSALTGGAFSVELEATTASNTGLTAGMRGNLVLPDGVLTNAGTYYGTMAEVFLGGAAVNTTAYTTISPLGIVISGTAPTAASQLANMVAMDITVPANMVTADGTMVVTGATGAVAAGLKIKINGTDYWIMLATADE